MKMKFKSIGQKLQNEQWYLFVIIKTFNAKKKKRKSMSCIKIIL